MISVSCPGCTYSGQPHLEGCEHSAAIAAILKHQQQSRQWSEFMGAASQLEDDEVLVVTEYIRRFIASRPK